MTLAQLLALMEVEAPPTRGVAAPAELAGPADFTAMMARFGIG